MKKIIFIIVVFLVLFYAPAAHSDNSADLLRADTYNFTLGTGFIGIAGKMNKVWTNGYEIEINLGYRFTPNIGIETGGMVGFTGMAEGLKISESYIDQYGDTTTGNSTGGLYFAFPVGLTFSWQVPGTSFVLMAGGGANYGFENEQGLGGVSGYRQRSTGGFGYYWEAGSYICAGKESMKAGIRFRLMDNSAGVKDFAGDAFGNAAKTTADDIRYMIILEAGGL
jgi:hypothetical protein